ncbi:MAG TPA: LysE family transporter [Actinomycetes bacterium]|nr:LysE family transporter [Actinomycetes bacterium]
MLGSIAAATVRWGSIWPLVVTALALMGSPGPATVSLAAAGSAYGVRRSLGYLAGIVLGTAVVLVAVAAGITVTLLAVPVLRSVLVALSVAYILWLAYRIATTPRPGEGPAATPPSLAGGVLLGVANPKAWVAIAAVFASTRLAGTATADAAAKVAVLSLVMVLIMVAWLLAGACFASTLRDPGRARVVNLALAAALVGSTALAVLR